MTTYKGVKGIGIQSVDADAIASQILGGSWASGGDLNTTRALGLILHEDRYEFIAPKEITSLVAAIPMLQELIPVIESIATELK